MIEIYFDGILLDNSNYLAFDVSFQPFDKEFYLGSTGSITASLKIPKGALPPSLNNVVIKIDGENWFSCVVDSLEENDNEEYVITLMDPLINTEVEYDFSEKVPIDAKTLLENICNDFNIPHDEFNFINQECLINSYDSTVTAREYLSMIAELAGGYITINNDGKLEIRTYLNSIGENTILADEVDTFKIKNTVTIGRVVWQFGNDKKESSEDSSLYTVYLDGNNMFLQNMSDEMFANICNNIIGFTFSSIKIDTTNKFFNDKKVIKFIDRENKEYNLLPFFEAGYNGGFVGSYDSNLENGKQNETKVNSTAKRVKRIKQLIDQDSNLIQTTVEDINTQKEVINPEFSELINANTTLIQQTDKSIRQEVSDKEEKIRGDIKGVNENLSEIEESLLKQITENKASIEVLSQSITNTVKSVGGNNLLRNSVGFAKSRETRKSKNLLDYSTLTPGDITGANPTIRLSTRQEIWLRAGTYHVTTDLPANYQFSVLVQDEGLPPLSEWPNPVIHDSTWYAAGSTYKTFTISLDGWFTLTVKKLDGSAITIDEVRNYKFQLAEGSTSLPYEEYGIDILDYESLDFWETYESRNITSVQDIDTESSTVSGSKIIFNNISKMEQEYVTQPRLIYGVSLKLKHEILGGNASAIKFYIIDGETTHNILETEQETREYQSFTQLSEFKYTAETVNPKLVIETTGDDIIEISDLIISQGENQPWSSYFDEVYGKEHRLDRYGLKLTDLASGDYSEQTVNGIRFIDNEEVVAELSGTKAKSSIGEFDNQITLRKLQWVVLDENNIIEYIN